MPALLTHNLFGRDVYAKHFMLIGESREEHEAFLLGNQGPDPLYFGVINRHVRPFAWMGHALHEADAADVLCAFKRALDDLAEGERPAGRAYLLGFLCHFELDSAAHPLIFAQEFAFCDAGIPGLTRKNASAVHGIIERELDETVLFRKTALTIAEFPPADNALSASEPVLSTVSKLYVSAIRRALHADLPRGAFASSVRDFRAAQRFFYSPFGRKRSILGAIERLRHPYSLYSAISHRAIEATECDFDNHERFPWIDPFSGKVIASSFWDIFDEAEGKAGKDLALLDDPLFDEDDARSISQGLDFLGEPVGNDDELAVRTHGPRADAGQ